MDDNKKDFIIDVLLDSSYSVNFILDAQLATEIAKELMVCGIEFTECQDFYELIKNSEILSIAKNVYEDGEEDYFFQLALNDNGETLGDESDFVYIESILFDIIDTTKFSGQVVELPDEEDFDDECLGDCECCQCDNCDCNCEEEIYEYYDDEDNDSEDIDDFLEEKVQDFLKLLSENESNENFCLHCGLYDLLFSVYKIAYEDGVKSLALSIGEIMDKIVED